MSIQIVILFSDLYILLPLLKALDSFLRPLLSNLFLKLFMLLFLLCLLFFLQYNTKFFNSCSYCSSFTSSCSFCTSFSSLFSFYTFLPLQSPTGCAAPMEMSLSRLVKSIYGTCLLHFHKNAFANFINVQGRCQKGRGEREGGQTNCKALRNLRNGIHMHRRLISFASVNIKSECQLYW